MIKKPALIVMCLTGLILSSCKFTDDKETFCDVANVIRQKCPTMKVQCSLALSTTSPDVAAKVKACYYRDIEEEFVFSHKYPEIGGLPCCVEMQRSLPQK